MTEHDRSRRRFLGGLGALLGLTGAGVLGRRVPSGEGSAAPGSTTPLPSSTPTATEPSSASSTVTTAPGPTTTTTSAPTTQAPAVLEIAAICRDAWGALPVAGPFAEHRIERLTVHHTAALLEDGAMAPAHLRGHQRYHLERGWPDLAYHFVIDAAGNVYEGRPVEAVGDTGTGYDPTGHFLVCCEGNFDEQDVTDAQLASLAAVLAWAAATYGVSPDTIRGHRDWAATSCPGDRLYPLVADGRLAAMAAGVATGRGVVLSVECGDTARQRVAAIERGSA